MRPSHVSPKDFLQNLQRSGLMTTQEIKSVISGMTATNRGRVIARRLVDSGVLTKFQAELLLAGRTKGFLLGQYCILDQLGEGGMGRVFKAIHRTMNRTVALKVLSPQLMKTERARAMFNREVRAAAQLMHPNIVTAYDANQVGGRYFLVMEFVDGPNLEQLVHHRGALPIGWACEIIRQIATGLQYAHELGMVHRDIKPANMLIHRPGSPTDCVVKILDFGLARLQDPSQDDSEGSIIMPGNTVMGTPDYLSPEQGRSMHELDIRSDIYGLGCTFYFLLTGQVPFPGGDTISKLIRHRDKQPQVVSDVRRDVSTDVRKIVERMMAKRPEHRFQTPIEVAGALEPYATFADSSWDDANTMMAPTVGNTATTSLDEDSDLDDKSEDSVVMLAHLPADSSSSDADPTEEPKVVSDRWKKLLLALIGFLCGIVILAVVFRLL